MDFLKAKFDNLSLFVMILVLVATMVYFQDREDDKVVAWFEQTITTVLGAYIGLTQAHRLISGNGNGNGNGKTPQMPDVTVPPNMTTIPRGGKNA